MKKNKVSQVSVREIAKAAGVSKSTAGYVLSNQAGPNQETREKVRRVAERLGYAPDAHISFWMARIRGAKSKDLLPVAWLNTHAEKDAWRKYRYLTPYFEGAQERAQLLGYRIEEFWTQQPGLTMRRLSQILFQRGIESVIVSYQARHIRLDWDHLASVAIGASLLAPRLHRITADVNLNLQLVLKSLRRFGYRRIGVCLARRADIVSHESIRATARDIYFGVPSSERIPPLFHPLKAGAEEKAKEIAGYLKRYKPDVIVGHDFHLVQWIQDAGFRVPHDVGLVHLAIDDDVLDWAGIHANKREIGGTAAEWVISLAQNRRFGVPKTALTTLVRGSWRPGNTLLIPKPR